MKLSLNALALAAFSLAIPFNIQSFIQNYVPQLPFAHPEHELISLHKSLVEIESISGNEYEVGKYLANYLTSKGFNVEVQNVAKNRNNIYAYIGDSFNHSKVLLTSHIDTVPPYIPYYTTSDFIFGRGSNDAKASVATQIISTLELIESEEIEQGDVSLLFVVGEEYDGIGMKTASSSLDAHWEHVVFGEPTELKLGIGHKGVYHFDIEITGKASHSGYPQLGIDANTKLINLLYKIINAEYPVDELLGNSTINPGLIEGGVAGNVVSPIAKAKVLVRVAHDAARVQQIIRKIVDHENQEHHNIKLSELQIEEPVYLDYKVPGFDTAVMAYFTDVPNLKKTDVQSRYLYGPGSITHAHTADEHVAISDLVDAVVGYKELVRYLLKQ